MHPSPEVVQIGKKIRELREQLTKARRAAEPEPVADYTFTSPDGDPVTLASLFGSGPDLLVVHNMGRSCPYCTLWADGFVGFAGHLADRARFVLSSPDQPAELKEFAQSRGWNYPVVSHAGTTFAKDMGFEPEPGKFMSAKTTTARSCARARTSSARATTTARSGACSTCSRTAPKAGSPSTLMHRRSPR